MIDSLSQKLEEDIKELMLRNRRVSGVYQYTVPSPEAYPYQWLWDSCFHALILSHFSLEDAKKEILSLVSKQLANGLVPHIIYWEKHEAININWGTEGTSSITQPPMIAYAAWRIFEKDGDLNFLKKIYPNLFHYYKYLINERDPHEKHLIGILNPDESGEDDSPRFDISLGLPPNQSASDNFSRRLKLVRENEDCRFDAPFCMRNFFWVKDVPFNSIIVENLRCLSLIAGKLEKTEDAAYFSQKSEDIIGGMRRFMLEDGLFWSAYGADYKHIKTKTWAIFAPLFARILTQDEAGLLVEKHLTNPKEFLAAYSVPTVSLDEPSFNPNGFWRGPVWMATNWFLFKGLINYGFNERANIIKENSIRLLETAGFRERFNPLTGEGIGAKNFTWGGLVIDMRP